MRTELKEQITKFKDSKQFNKKDFRKWAKALRSGKYKQTRTGVLYNEKRDSYCCLGVAVKVCGWKGYQLFPDSQHLSIDLQNYFVKLNDTSHKSFKYIADRIETLFLKD